MEVSRLMDVPHDNQDLLFLALCNVASAKFWTMLMLAKLDRCKARISFSFLAGVSDVDSI
jgi:hypothetical protein